MDPLADGLSGASLVAVVIIGWRSIVLGGRAARSAEQSARSSESAGAATERSAAATERAAVLAASDARYRRAEALLDVVLEMRDLFNRQNAIHGSVGSGWNLTNGSPEQLARLALMRSLEGRFVPFETELDSTSNTRILSTTSLWMSGQLEGAIEEIKAILRSFVSGYDNSGFDGPGGVTGIQG